MPSSVPGRAAPVTLLALAAILGLGAGLRFWAVDAGAPYRMSVDEPVILGIVLRMLQTGSFHPHFFDYGSLTFYLHTAVGTLTFLAGAMDGRWTRVDALWHGDLLVAGRMLTALLGTLTIGVVFRIGQRWGQGVGLIAALLMAVLPLHVRESHFVLTDVPLTFFIALGLLVSIRALETRRALTVILAGGVIGLAMAVKYTGVVALVMPCLAALALPPGRRLAAAAGAVAAAGGVFLACAPYTILDLPGFLNGLGALAQSYNVDRSLADTVSIYLGHLRGWFAWPGRLPLWLGYLGLALAAAGFARAVGWGPHRHARLSGALLALFPLVYFGFVSTQSLLYGRYLLPVAPALCVGVAIGILHAASWLGRIPRLRGGALPLLILLVAGMPAASAIDWNRAHSRPTTMELAAAWLVEHAPRGAQVVVEDSVLQLPPQLVLVHSRNLVARTIDEYRESGAAYLVASSYQSDRYYADPARHQDQIAAYHALMATTVPVATFTPNAAISGPTVTVLQVTP